jgi:alpha-2-macroglobulin
VTIALQLPPSLSLIGEIPAAVDLAPGEETVVRFRLRAGEALGALPVKILARAGDFRAARSIELSLRPAIMSRVDLRLGRADAGRTVELGDLRTLYPERAARLLSASTSPLVAVDGLAEFLAAYPHLCTEQLVSQAMPALVYRSRPEFANRPATTHAGHGRLLEVLRSRQNSAGGFGLWLATPHVDPFVSGYVALYLIEARERGEPVPQDLLDASNRHLQQVAADPALAALHELRVRALATYLLLRQGHTVTSLLSSLQEQMQRDHPQTWQQDTAGLLLAASYQLLQQQRPARELAAPALAQAVQAIPEQADWRFHGWEDVGVRQAWRVYLLYRHFPEQAARLDARAIEALLAPLRQNRYNTLSSAMMVLALDSVGQHAAAAGVPTLAAAADARAQLQPIGDAIGQLVRAPFTAGDRRLAVTAPSAAPAWYVLSQSGFDRSAPAATQSMGLEVIRDYLGPDLQPLQSFEIGREVTVRLRVRALGAEARGNIAIIDLLPGGFEAVMQLPAPAESSTDGASGEPVQAGLALPGSSLRVEHIEPREDRVILYASVGAAVSEFRYRIRPSNAGRFMVPPVYAESMYERSVYAQGGPAGSIDVVARPQ